MSENIYSRKYEWLWPILLTSVLGATAAYAVTEYKTEEVVADVRALEDRERGYIALIATLSENQRNIAETQERMANTLDRMDDKLDRALRRRDGE